MKLQIDTQSKTITIEEAISFGELYDMLSAMFPKMGWRDYLLCPVEKIEIWKDPIVVPWNPAPWIVPYTPPVIPYQPSTPWSFPIITCGTSQATFNLELKSEI
jgi:hypothetical protein